MEQVVISSVDGNKFIDARGRNLVRIGNMTVRAGDVVWTDGRCIYGNMLHGNRTIPPLAFGSGLPPGIPLNVSSGDLLVFTKSHSIVKATKAKQRCFVNNDKFYALNSTKPFRDLDISSKGKIWEIDIARAGYSENTPSSYKTEYYDGPEWGSVTDTTFTSEAHPERNYQTTDNKLHPMTCYKYVISVGEKSVSTNNPVTIRYDGKDVGKIDMENLTTKIRGEISSVMGRYSGRKVVNSVSVSVFDGHIDENGRTTLFIRASAAGKVYTEYYRKNSKFKTYTRKIISDTDMQSLDEYKWDTEETIKTHTDVEIVSYNQPFMVVYSCFAECYYIVDGGSFTEVSRNIWASPSKKTVWYSTNAGGIDQTAYQGDYMTKGHGGLSTLGVFIIYETQDGRTPVHIYYEENKYADPGFSEKSASNGYFPIQDEYYVKTRDDGTGLDDCSVYRGTAFLFKAPSKVYGITEVNKGKGDYLVLCGSSVFLYQDGEFIRVKWKNKDFYVTNYRLRYMKNTSALKK